MLGVKSLGGFSNLSHGKIGERHAPMATGSASPLAIDCADGSRCCRRTVWRQDACISSGEPVSSVTPGLHERKAGRLRACYCRSRRITARYRGLQACYRPLPQVTPGCGRVSACYKRVAACCSMLPPVTACNRRLRACSRRVPGVFRACCFLL